MSNHNSQQQRVRHQFQIAMHTNPFALGGWYNPQNPLAEGHQQPNLPQPPTFGTLPPPDASFPLTQTFEFGSFNTDVMNCLVTNEGGRIFFKVETSVAATTSIFKGNEPYAFIQWEEHPLVQTSNGSISRQPTGSFLKLSDDKRYRVMIINGKQYAWFLRDSGIFLYSTGPHAPSQLARVTLTSNNTKLTLQIASEAFQAGLFEPCIISVVLLFSNRNID